MLNRTSIVVAHRLTTVKQCKRLAVIEDGRVVEEGTFEDLEARENGYFKNLKEGMKKREQKEQK
jgi:ABC-type multidrug transport system fused ATPase/permease subunit